MSHEHVMLAHRAASAIVAAFDDYEHQFSTITRRAMSRFEARDWHGMQHDAVERLGLYGRVIGAIVAEVCSLLGESVHNKSIWAAMKADYSDQIRACLDIELAETFFNSVTRRIFATVGVDARIEFLFSDFDQEPPAGAHVYTAYPTGSRLPEVLRRILRVCAFSEPFEDMDRDIRLVIDAIEAERRAQGVAEPIDAIDMIRSVFFRNKGAYLVGRIRSGNHIMPLTLALRHDERGIYVDASLLTADEVSIIFSFTRASFHVEVYRPRDLVEFLKSIMPHKPIAELYIAIGYNKHGKTELFRDLVQHIGTSADQFQIAPGDRGMVMIVFTLPSFDVVFKIIRDRFDFPKNSTRREVMDKYQLVFKHDRAGRLADVQEFEHLAFPRDRFAPDLLEELTNGAAETVSIEGDIVHIKHLYTERRMTPLNVYLLTADERQSLDAILDYGQAVKDMASTNIFPGDMLLKNFGVTRHGRVVFYDYDELCLVTDCNYRDMPTTGDYDEELGAEPWFYVGPTDVFPEEFIRFLGLSGYLREAFLMAHGELLTAAYWRQVQERHRAGDIMDIIPYRASRRLPTGHAAR